MSRFDERFLDELKGRLRLSDVIGRSVKLRRQGREYVGLSPFAKEKTPSFFVNDDKGFFHDFSSGKHGDLIGFLQETERLSFREAVERLAAEAGLPLPAEDPRAAAAEQRRLGLQDWLEEAAKWFEAQLRRPQGEAARAYLDKRGLPKDEWGRFRLGYAPAGRTALKDHLVAKGAQPRDLVEAGLLIAPEDGAAAPYDRFRERVIFPITDHRGRVVSFGGRALDPEARAKYLNGPESPVFHKSAVLYGLPEARRLLHLEETQKPDPAPGLVVVEGYMDVIACQRAGVAAVAAMGTALTEEQMEALWRVSEEPTLCFDGDAAGRRAAARAMDRALPLLQPGRSFAFAFPEGGKDPDDVLRDQGAAVLRAQLSKTIPFVQHLFNREMSVIDVRDIPEARAGVKSRLKSLSASIPSRDVAEEYRNALIDRFYEYTGQRKNRAINAKINYAEAFIFDAATVKQKLQLRIRRFNALVAIGAIHNPEWALDFVEDFVKVGFGDARMDAVIPPLIDALSSPNLSSHSVVRQIRAAGAGVPLQAIYYYAFETPLPLQADLSDSEHSYQVWLLAVRMMIELSYVEKELKERSHKRDVIEEEVANYYVERGRELRGRLVDLRYRTMMHEGWPWANAILQTLDVDASEPVRQWRKRPEDLLTAQAEAAAYGQPFH